MLRAARIKFVAVTMFILLGLFIVMGSTIYGLLHNNVTMGTEVALRELLEKVNPGDLQNLDVHRGAILRESASGDKELVYDESCYNAAQIEEFFEQAKTSGLRQGQIGDTYFKLFERADGTVFIAADRSIERAFESQSVTFFTLTLAGAYIVLFFIVWGASYFVMKPIQNAFVQQNRFISDASHELKTPLAIISASADVLYLEDDNEYVDNIRTQTRRMNALISDLLSLAKMDETKALLDNSEQNLSAVIAKCVLQFDALAFERNREIVTDIEPNVVIPCDKASVEKVVTILVDNALKYSDETEIVCTLKKAGDKAVFSVYNKSETITADAKNKIFERFYRAENSRNRETGGSGLGLSIAKKIADINKWKITANIEEHKSITFNVTF